MLKNNVAIIGAGPSGVSAALQLNKYGISPLIFECNEIGGLLRNAYSINNLPGYPNGIIGKKLAQRLEKHLLKSNNIIPEKVCIVQFSDDNFNIMTTSSVYQSDYLVVASGTKPVSFDSITFSENQFQKIHYDIIRLFEEKKKKILIIGAGDAAFDYALSMSRFNEVLICNRKSTIKCNIQLYQEAMKNKRITYWKNSILKQIIYNEDGSMTALIQKNEIWLNYLCSHIIFAIGRIPNIDFLDKLDLNVKNKLIKSKRLFIIGDAANGNKRQTAICFGDGSRAAIDIYMNICEKIK